MTLGRQLDHHRHVRDRRFGLFKGGDLVANRLQFRRDRAKVLRQRFSLRPGSPVSRRVKDRLDLLGQFLAGGRAG